MGFLLLSSYDITYEGDDDYVRLTGWKSSSMQACCLKHVCIQTIDSIMISCMWADFCSACNLLLVLAFFWPHSLHQVSTLGYLLKDIGIVNNLVLLM